MAVLSPAPRLARFPARWLLLLGALLLTALPVLTEESFQLSDRALGQAEKRFGPEARQRLLDWQELLRTASGDDRHKLERVNRFFNALAFVDDSVHWYKNDYWATPIEFLASGGGDCEDFAIAKFFTLLQLGVPENRLTLTYVKAVRLNQAHMVLSYYPAPGAEPLVLDNLVDTIQPSSKRTDLLPVYSLNGTGLWLAKQRGRGKLISSDSSRLARWRELLDRWNDQDDQGEVTQ